MLSSISASSADQPAPNSPPAETVTVDCCDRWQVYHRLQELEIPCQCGGFESLRVQIKTPADAIQLWSIVRRVSESRLVLADSLQRCWQAF